MPDGRSSPASLLRCQRKRTYWNGTLADKAAQRASAKTGELIISYQCYECHRWHIGHADLSQILARIPPGRALCEVCGQPIDANRLDKAKKSGTLTTTCSKPCKRELDSRQKQQRRQAAPPAHGEDAQNGAAAPVPKGLSEPTP